MLSGTLAPNAGSIRFEGREIAGQPPYRIINLGIGRTFQIPRPFRRLSLLDNVVLAGYFGQGRHSRAKAFGAAERALGLVGLPTDRATTVDGLGAAALKKLELAKALATEPKLLLADESLSGLDEHEMDQAAELLRRICRELGVTIIWVEHIMGVLMRVVDRVMVLDHGEKIAEGLPARVASDARVIEGYLCTRASAVASAAADDGGGQSEDGRLRAGRAPQVPPPARGRLRAVPTDARAPPPARRQHVGGRAADVRDRARADVRAEAAPPGRAVRGAGAGSRRAGVRAGQSHPRQRPDRADRRAERAAGAPRGRSRVPAQDRPHPHHRGSRRAAGE